MTRKRDRSRASQALLDELHQHTTRAVLTELKRVKKAKEPVSSGLLQAAIKLLTVTETTAPKPDHSERAARDAELQTLLGRMSGGAPRGGQGGDPALDFEPAAAHGGE